MVTFLPMCACGRRKLFGVQLMLPWEAGHKQRMLAKRYVILEEGLSFFERGMEDGAQ